MEVCLRRRGSPECVDRYNFRTGKGEWGGGFVLCERACERVCERECVCVCVCGYVGVWICGVSLLKSLIHFTFFVVFAVG